MVLLTTVVLLAACARTADDPVPPGAVLLRANIPTTVGDLTLAAGNVEEDRAALSVSDGTSPATVIDLEVGDTVVVDLGSFTLAATRVGGNDRENLPDAAAWVVVEQP